MRLHTETDMILFDWLLTHVNKCVNYQYLFLRENIKIKYPNKSMLLMMQSKRVALKRSLPLCKELDNKFRSIQHPQITSIIEKCTWFCYVDIFLNLGLMCGAGVAQR